MNYGLDLINSIASYFSPKPSQSVNPKDTTNSPSLGSAQSSPASEIAQQVLALKTPPVKFERVVDSILQKAIERIEQDEESFRSARLWVGLAQFISEPVSIRHPLTKEIKTWNKDQVSLKAAYLWRAAGGLYDNGKTKDNPAACRRDLIAKIWMTLGMIGADFQIGEEPFSPSRCFVQALEASPDLEEAWVQLGMNLRKNNKKVVFLGKQITALDCFIKLLSYPDRKYHQSDWLNIVQILLSDKLSQITINNKKYSPLDCCLEALKFKNQNDTLARFILSRCLTHSTCPFNPRVVCLEGKKMNSLQVLLSILNPDLSIKIPFNGASKEEDESDYWNEVGFYIASNDEKDLSLPKGLGAIFCFKKAIDLAASKPSKAIKWTNLGLYLNKCIEEGKEKTQASNTEISCPSECFLKALELGERNLFPLWNGLATSLFLEDKESVLFKEKKLTPLDCAVEALKLEWKNVELHKTMKKALAQSGKRSVPICFKSGLEVDYTQTTADIMIKNAFNEDLFIEVLVESTNPEIESKLQETIYSISLAIKESGDLFLALELEKEEKRKNQSEAQLEKNKLAAAQEKQRQAAQIDVVSDKKKNQQEDRQSQSSAKAKSSFTAFDNDDQTLWKTVPYRTTQKNEKSSKIKISDYLGAPFELYDRITRWISPQLALSDVIVFENIDKSKGGVVKLYEKYDDHKIRKEIIAHYVPQGLEQLIGNPLFQEKYCIYEGKGTYTLRTIQRGMHARIVLGVFDGKIYHARTEFEPKQGRLSSTQRKNAAGASIKNEMMLKPVSSLPEHLRGGVPPTENLIELSNCVLPAVSGVNEPFSCFILPNSSL